MQQGLNCFPWLLLAGLELPIHLIYLQGLARIDIFLLIARGGIVIKLLLIIMISLAVVLPVGTSVAVDDKSVKAERQEAQKLRQQQKNERNREIQDASRSFREFTRDLKKEYQERARDLDTNFKLQQVDMRAERNAKIAETEAEMQQKTIQLFLNPSESNDGAALDQLKADMKSYSDQLFEIKEQAAIEEHSENMKNELEKHRLMDERDAAALDMASDLGLRGKYEPVLAKPIGDGLTKQEEDWNAREKKEVEKLFNRNQRLLGEFLYGKKLRGWELDNKRADFDLGSQKKSELHTLNLEQSYYNSLFMQSSTDGEFDQKAFNERMSEIQKQNRLINIKYKKIRDKNRIKRTEQRRGIVAFK